MSAKPTKAIVLADRSHRSLEYWRPTQQLPLLRIGEVTLIEHCVRALVRAGIRDIDIALGPNSRAIERHLGDGARWGVKFSFMAGLGDEAPSILLPRMTTLSERTLVLRGDVYRDDIVREFLERAAGHNAENIGATSKTASLLMACLTSAEASEQFLVPRGQGIEEQHSWLEFADSRVIEISTSNDFLEANARALTVGKRSGRLDAMHTRQHVFADVDALVHASVQCRGLAYVGQRSRVCADVRFDDTVVLGDRVVVGKGARLSNVVVLDDAMIPRGARLSNAIVIEERATALPQTLESFSMPAGSAAMSNQRRARTLLRKLSNQA